MFDYTGLFEAYRRENSLDLSLSFTMPEGYETANGTFDIASKTVFINAEYLDGLPDYEKAFYFFHELRHAAQYLHPEQFSDAIVRSSRYVIMYDGTCGRLVNGQYYECRLEGDGEFFTDAYLGQPYEADANTFACERVKALYGDSEGLQKLFSSWMPRHPVTEDRYRAIYDQIDEKTGQ